MHRAVRNILKCQTPKGSLGFSIDGKFVEIRMDDIRKAVSKGLVSREDLSVIENMFPKPVSGQNYIVTTQALICAESATSVRQSSHMDSMAPHLVLQNAFYNFPESQCSEEYQKTVRATVFKNIHISNHLDLETCDISEIQELFQVDWETLPEVGLTDVDQGDTAEFEGHIVHYGPGPEKTSIKYLRTVAFQVNQPLGNKEEHPPEEEYQVRQYYLHFLKHPNVFFQNISEAHPFWNDFCNHTPYNVIQGILKRVNIKRSAHVSRKRLLTYINEQKQIFRTIDTVDCKMCGQAARSN